MWPFSRDKFKKLKREDVVDSICELEKQEMALEEGIIAKTRQIEEMLEKGKMEKSRDIQLLLKCGRSLGKIRRNSKILFRNHACYKRLDFPYPAPHTATIPPM